MKEDRATYVRAALLISVLVFCTLALLRSAGTMQAFDLIAYDFFTTIQPNSDHQSPVVLINITEEDIRYLGGWPITDAAMADVITAVNSQQPRTIGVDIYRDVPVPPGTPALEDTWRSTDNLVAIYKFASESNPGVNPPAALAGTARTGFSDIVLDPGQIVRRGLAFMDDGQEVGYSFALRLALAYLAKEGHALVPATDDASRFTLGGVHFEPISPQHGAYINVDTSGYQFMVDYQSLQSGFIRYSMQDVLQNNIPENAFTDRVVIFGVDAVSVKDSFATPFSVWPGSGDITVPGLAVHGTIVDQFIRAAKTGDKPLGTWSETTEYLTFFLSCLLAGCLGLLSRSAGRLLTMAAIGLVSICLLGYGLMRLDIWLPIVPTIAGWLVTLAFVTAYLVQRERRDRSTLQRMFAAQTSPEMAESLWARRDEFLQHGRFQPKHLNVSVLFVDLGGFTGISENLAPDTLMEWIHKFMATATGIITEHGGVVDDYFGDGIKANFGVPFSRTSEEQLRADAQQAAACMLKLECAVIELNNQRAPTLPGYTLRAGISSGPVVLGALGTAQRQKYTSIGDTVNVAARIEGLGKELGVREHASIMVSATTAQLLGDGFDLHCHGSIDLRGRNMPVEVYEVTGRKSQSATANRSCEQ